MFHSLQVIFHGIGQIAEGIQLVAGDITCGGVEQAGNTVDHGGTGVLHGGGFNHMELGVRFAGDPPVALISSSGPYTLPMVSSSTVIPWRVSG